MMHRLLQFPSQWEWHMLHDQTTGLSGLTRSRKHAGIMPRRRGTEPAGRTVAGAPLDIKQAHPDIAGWLQEVEGHAS